MSPRNSGAASTSTDLRSGCGRLSTGVLPSRLGENACATERASGVPAVAVNRVLRSSICIVLWTRLNSTRPDWRSSPPYKKSSPMPLAMRGANR